MGAHDGSQYPPGPPQGPGHQAPTAPSWTPQGPPPQKPRGSLRMLSTVAALGAAVGMTLGFALFSKGPAISPAASVQPAVTETVHATVTQTVSPKATRTPKPSPSSMTVDDGTWVVGDDIPAGTYKASAPVDSDCYWKISKSGTNGDTIIQNDFPGGGKPVVTLRRGQDFHTARCGSWMKR